MTDRQRVRLLYFVEGFTDIRFVIGLSEIADLTMVVPEQAYRSSGLKDRVAESGITLTVHEIPGGRLAFQWRSLTHLWRRIRDFDVVLSQEVLRGSVNATLVGRLRGVPVITYMGIAPVEYFRCRRERRQIGLLPAIVGEAVIRSLMWVNGKLASHSLAMGPYLERIAARYSSRTSVGLYYGIDTEHFRPASADERRELRRRHDLPDGFLIYLSSRISHEKDPETVVAAAVELRRRGIDAHLVNTGGGWKDFLALVERQGVERDAPWIIARPALHPMREVSDYFRAADVAVLASLAEGAAFSTLEALACGTPLVATAVGGMAVQLEGYATLTPRQDAAAMADAFHWVAQHPDEARGQALRGRAHVEKVWSRRRAFAELRELLEGVSA